MAKTSPTTPVIDSQHHQLETDTQLMSVSTYSSPQAPDNIQVVEQDQLSHSQTQLSVTASTPVDQTLLAEDLSAPVPVLLATNTTIRMQRNTCSTDEMVSAENKLRVCTLLLQRTANDLRRARGQTRQAEETVREREETLSERANAARRLKEQVMKQQTRAFLDNTAANRNRLEMLQVESDRANRQRDNASRNLTQARRALREARDREETLRERVSGFQSAVEEAQSILTSMRLPCGRA